MHRRDFLKAGAGAVVASSGCANHNGFTFVHFTDTHIQPELRAADGCRQCFDRINAVRPEFAICGGDLVFDALETPKPRAKQVYDLYAETTKPLTMPVHTVIGNHDVFGLSTKSGVSPDEPEYGKKMFEDRIGPRYSSFDHKGWHFVLLDSIGITPERKYVGGVDDQQLDWLKSDLARAGKQTPIIAVTHIPLVTGMLQIFPNAWKSPASLVVTNVREVLSLFAPYNVKAVLQGHTHVNETVNYKGCQYITTGAVSGNWWKGAHLGHPEGFGVVTVRDGDVHWRYETYGFQAVPSS